MAKRTTIVFDEQTQRAARELARRYDCTVSEAIRRAVVQQRDSMNGVGAADRRWRKKTLERLFDLFEGADPEGEIRRLKSEDSGF